MLIIKQENSFSACLNCTCIGEEKGNTHPTPSLTDSVNL
jgi:hypothetical protein